MKIVPSIAACLPPLTIRRNHCTAQKFKTSTVYAKKVDGSPDISSRTKNSTLLQYKKLRLTNYTLAKLALTIFGLGFIDAGYSGDWSRINVISKETEEFLKLATFVLVPLLLFSIIYISKKEKDSI